MPPPLRKAIGAVAILAFMSAYVVAALWVADRVLSPDSPWWLQLSFFAIAGIAWVLPLRPLFSWMNRDR